MGGSKTRNKSPASSKAASSSETTFKDLLSPRILGFKLPWYWTLIALALFVFLIDMQTRMAIKSTAFSVLAPLAYSGETKLRNAGYGFDGALHVYDISYAPEDGSAPIRVGQVDVETPGFWWVVQQVLPDSKPSRSERMLDELAGSDDSWYYPATPRLVLHLRNLDWGDYGLGGLAPGVRRVGPFSGALFEAEGCPTDSWWTADDLRDRFGVDPGTGDIRIDFEVTGERSLRRTLHFGHAGLSELTIRSDYELPGPAKHFLDQLGEDWRTTAIQWTVQDLGFVALRNQFCADAAKIDVPTLVDRHLRSIERLFAEDGIAASAEVLDAYARYARDGGKLEWATHLPPGRAYEDYDSVSLDAAMSGIAATLTVGDHEVAYMLSEVPNRPLPDLIASTWEIIEHETGSATAPAAAAAGHATTAATAAEASSPAVPTSASASAPAVRSAAEQLKYVDLLGAVGSQVELTLEGDRRLRGLIESATAQQIELRIRMAGGYARMAIQRHRVVGARRI